MIGQSILHYKIIEKLGEGGMGVVYLAEDQKLERKVAIKFLPSRISGSPDERERFKIEAKAAAALNHPNIATIYAIEDTEEHTFISMEYIEGKELKTLLGSGENNGLEISDAIKYAIQIAEGLKAAHHKGIIHRDIKSSNIMITGDGNVKIMDFGLAKIKGGTLLTKIGTTVGTASYISPEQARGENVDQRTDIWSFGIVLFEMLTGKLPFRSEYEQAIIYSIMNESPESAGSLRPEVLPELEIIINNCLSRKINDRYQNADELIEDLNALLRGTSAIKNIKLRSSSVRRRHYVVPVIIIGILCAIITGYFIIRELSFKGSPTEIKQNSLAVMYFDNQSGEKDIDKILVNMLTTNLARYKDLNVVSSQHLFDILKSLGKENIQSIDRNVATEIARRVNVNSILIGSIIKIGSRFRINAQLLDVNNGNIINSYEEDGSKVEDVFLMADHLTEKIQENFNPANLLPDKTGLKIADVTTASYEAYKYYEMGLEKLWRWEVDAAATDFEHALKIDSTFAIAYLQLARARANNYLNIIDYRYNIIPIRELLNKAKYYSAKATDKERWEINVNKALFDRDFNLADSLAKIFVNKFPDDRDANILLGWTSWFLGNYPESIQAADRTLEIDPTYTGAYTMLAYDHSFLGEHKQAISLIKKVLALQPDADNNFDTAFEIYLQADLPEDAIKICDQWAKIKGFQLYYYLGYVYIFVGNCKKARDLYISEIKENPRTERLILTFIGYSYLNEGKYNDAVAALNKSLKETVAAGNQNFEIYTHFILGKAYLEKGDFSDALKQFNQAGQLSDLVHDRRFNPDKIVSEYFIGLTYLREGNYQNAQDIAEKIMTIVEKENYDNVFMDFYWLLRGAIAVSLKDTGNAVHAVSELSPFTMMFPRRQVLIAETYALDTKNQEAINTLNSFKNKVTFRNSYMGGDQLDYLLERSRINYNIAKIYDHEGDKVRAKEYYSKVLEQWKNGDNDLAGLNESRVRLAQLNR